MPTDTIVAIATAAGAGGVGMVRLSGHAARTIAEAICGQTLRPRQAHYVRFFDSKKSSIDDGIALSFSAPHSYTGENVVELQAHGSPVVLQQLVLRACELGARPARPGEFSERAFLNDKLDLAQAEAVADLIAASDVRAARAARRALDGVFSQRVDGIHAQLLALRIHIEAAIDFADESLDTLGGAAVQRGAQQARHDLEQLLLDAERGRKLRDGVHVVIIGPPNAGKSSLLNALAGRDRAIVTEVAGTTRDTLHETVQLDGVEINLVDTAGLRSGGDAIEREGMRRARSELERADLAIVVLDARETSQTATALVALELDHIALPKTLYLYNKVDLLPSTPADDLDHLYVSAQQGIGIDRLQTQLRAMIVGDVSEQGSEGEFSARTRHVQALQQALQHLNTAETQLQHEILELAAEELRQAHDALGAITGKLTADDLLGKIFSTFCIGK